MRHCISVFTQYVCTLNFSTFFSAFMNICKTYLLYVTFAESTATSLKNLEQNCFCELLKYSTTFNPLSAKLTKWPNTLKQFVGKLPTNCLSVFGHFVGLALKGSISLGTILQIFAPKYRNSFKP